MCVCALLVLLFISWREDAFSSYFVSEEIVFKALSRFYSIKSQLQKKIDKSEELVGTLTMYNAGLSRDTPANLIYVPEVGEVAQLSTCYWVSLVVCCTGAVVLVQGHMDCTVLGRRAHVHVSSILCGTMYAPKWWLPRDLWVLCQCCTILQFKKNNPAV